VVDRIEEVERKAIRKAAGQLRVQLGETILPLAGAEALEKGDDKVRVFRLNDGAQEIGYAFREVIDLMAMDNELIPADHPGAVSGVTLIGGEPAELLDAHWLFATHLGASARSAVQSVCQLPSDDPWMQNMLRPIVEAAGYLVIGEADGSIIYRPSPLGSSNQQRPVFGDAARNSGDALPHARVADHGAIAQHVQSLKRGELVLVERLGNAWGKTAQCVQHRCKQRTAVNRRAGCAQHRARLQTQFFGEVFTALQDVHADARNDV
jgi:hypothetical protein